MTVDTAGGVLLLINDNPAQLDAMSLLLTCEGFTAHTAESAESALDLLKRLTPDLIVSDVVMPGMDGIELCRRIKDCPATADIPLLLVSGLRYDDSSVAEGLEAGADDYLESDAPTSLLIKKTHRLVNQARERRQRLRAEAALRDSEQLYRAVTEAASDAIITIDEQSTVLFVNLAAERIFGHTAGEIVGGGLAKLMPDYLRHLHEAAIRRYVSTGERRLDWKGMKLPGLRKDGSEVPLEISFGESYVGGRHVFTGVVRDISERVRAELALKESEERFRSLVETAFDAMLIHSQGRIMEASRGLADLFGYSLAEVTGKSLLDLVAGESRLTVSEKIGSGAGQVYEAVGLKKDGTRFPIEVVGRDLTLGSELVRVTALRDLTREKQLEALARYNETMAAVGQLVAGVAHEVRNPLFALSSLLDAFEARFPDKTEHHRYTVRMRAEIERLNLLMQDLLQYGTPVTPEFKEGRIDEVIGEAVRSCEPMARKKNVTVAQAAEGPLPPVAMNRSRLTQAFINLIENALQHSPAGGVIQVQARQATGEARPWVECAIKDAGKGFEPEDLPGVFEPFFTRRREGTGLGLAIVERIVRAHAGSVSADNLPEGGAVVTLRLPSASEAGHLK